MLLTHPYPSHGGDNVLRIKDFVNWQSPNSKKKKQDNILIKAKASIATQQC